MSFPVEDLRHGLFERYTEGVEIVAAALRRLGVAAEGGAVEGEFCPGDYSVRSGGVRGVKHAGLAQRVTRRAARLEALILVEHTVELLEVLTKFHAALGLKFRPESIADLPVSVEEVMAALGAEIGERYDATEGRIEEAMLVRAREQRGRWRINAENPTPNKN